jgi:hypothetical protein
VTNAFGVPATTTQQPPEPPFGSRSMIQSASAMTL